MNHGQRRVTDIHQHISILTDLSCDDVDGIEYVGNGIFYIEANDGTMTEITTDGIVPEFDPEIVFDETTLDLIATKLNDNKRSNYQTSLKSL